MYMHTGELCPACISYFFPLNFFAYHILSSWNEPYLYSVNTLPKHEAQNLQVDLVLGHCSKLPWTLLDLQLDIQKKYPKFTTAVDNTCQRNKVMNYNTFIRRPPFFSQLQADYLQQTSNIFSPPYSISSSPPYLGCSLYFMPSFFSPPLSTMSVHLSLITFFHCFPIILSSSFSSSHRRGTLFFLIPANEDPFFYSSLYIPLP